MYLILSRRQFDNQKESRHSYSYSVDIYWYLEFREGLFLKLTHPLLTAELGRMTPEQQSVIESIFAFLGERAKRNTILVFTRVSDDKKMLQQDVVKSELHELQRKFLDETENEFVSYAPP